MWSCQYLVNFYRKVEISPSTHKLRDFLRWRNQLWRSLTLFRLGFFGRPWTGGGGGAWNVPLRFLKSIKDIDMKRH